MNLRQIGCIAGGFQARCRDRIKNLRVGELQCTPTRFRGFLGHIDTTVTLNRVTHGDAWLLSQASVSELS